MTTATATVSAQADRSTLLRRALQGDAIFGAISGVALLAASGPLSGLLGIPAIALLVVGAILVPYAAFLWYQATRPQISIRVAWAVIFLNIDWVIMSAVLLFSSLVPLTPLGWWDVLIVAVVVAAFAEAQYFGIRRMRG
jgi:hypothetical protein